jgi:hypothetical protein
MALLLGSCIFWLAVMVQASNVTYANAVGVMPLAVGTCLFQRPAAFDGSIYQYHIVVAYHDVALFAVPAVYIRSPKALALLSGRAMDDYFCYCSHILFF